MQMQASMHVELLHDSLADHDSCMATSSSLSLCSGRHLCRTVKSSERLFVAADSDVFGNSLSLLSCYLVEKMCFLDLAQMSALP